MTADQLYKALTWVQKPVTVARLAKAEARAASPAEYQRLVARLTTEGRMPTGDTETHG